ncbi:MAG: hypothetical protein JOY90_08200 [Bradyrhizobium sp.]|uniref:hypothetical protein n=1 Tax=Bradyrhizobium sp. TaxID=376 RepID=UPI001E039934|nr:hypothetical protein [Bradyrhizobium sp.]MBV9560426.1 hypothetical protein [Bradyrhizobium sp.]
MSAHIDAVRSIANATVISGKGKGLAPKAFESSQFGSATRLIFQAVKMRGRGAHVWPVDSKDIVDRDELARTLKRH